MVIPTVTEKVGGVSRSYDIYSRLLDDRIIFLGGEINDPVANLIVAQLLLLDSRDRKKPICLYINSPGGSVTSAMAIVDTMNHVEASVATICVGLAASAGGLILSSGEKGMRSALKNAEIMIHQPHLRGMGGQVTDVVIAAKQLNKIKARLNKIIAKNTGKSVEQVTEDMERDKYMSAEEAKRYGIIDEIH